MNLTPEQLKEVLGNGDGWYRCEFIKHRFAFNFFGNEISPFGSIVCFVAPTTIGPLTAKKALVVAAELPNVSMFGGVCFQRLYSAQLGTLISVFTGKDVYTEEGCILVDDKQLSVPLLSKVDESMLFHIVIPLEIETDHLQVLQLEEDKLEEFKANVVASFHHLSRSVFIESQRNNF